MDEPFGASTSHGAIQREFGDGSARSRAVLLVTLTFQAFRLADWIVLAGGRLRQVGTRADSSSAPRTASRTPVRVFAVSELARFLWERRGEIAASRRSTALVAVASVAIARSPARHPAEGPAARLNNGRTSSNDPEPALSGSIPIPFLGGIGARMAIVALSSIRCSRSSATPTRGSARSIPRSSRRRPASA
jgi:hypothetical protein